MEKEAQYVKNYVEGKDGNGKQRGQRPSEVVIKPEYRAKNEEGIKDGKRMGMFVKPFTWAMHHEITKPPKDKKDDPGSGRENNEFFMGGD